jgi:hypothetical protein
LRDHGTLLPEPLGGLVAAAFAELIKDNAGEFPCMEAGIQRFETVNLLADGCRDSGGRRLWDHLDTIEEQAKHALLLDTTPELPHGFGVGGACARCVAGRFSKRIKGRMSS